MAFQNETNKMNSELGMRNAEKSIDVRHKAQGKKINARGIGYDGFISRFGEATLCPLREHSEFRIPPSKFLTVYTINLLPRALSPIPIFRIPHSNFRIPETLYHMLIA